MKNYACLLLVGLAFVSSNIAASANTFIRETERLIAHSDKTYTVIVSQYEQTYSYLTGLNRLIIRVIDISTNEVISEALVSSARSDRSMEKPYTPTHSLMADESQVFKALLIEPQKLYNNLEYPKYRFHLDKRGVYIEKEGRQDLLEFSTLESRFAQAGSGRGYPLDSDSELILGRAIDSNTFEFTGWYKSGFAEQDYFFLVLAIGSFDDDTGGFEYVFSIPASSY